jgi:hypothetical protein
VRGLQVIGMSMDDDVAEVKKFLAQYPVSFPTAMGGGKFAEQFGGVLGLPLTYLIDAGAIGAVTTHDLTLAEDSSLDSAAQRVHFTERFEQTAAGMTMTFDYQLRPGLATSANALKLLAMIGLGEGLGTRD